MPKRLLSSGTGKRKPKTRQTTLVLTCTPNLLEINSTNGPKPHATKKETSKATKQLFEENEEEDVFS